MIGAIDASQRRFFLRFAAATLILPLLCYWLHIWTALVSMVVALGIAVGWSSVMRDFSRSVLLIYSRPEAMLWADACYAAVLVAGVAVAVSGPQPAILGAVFALAVATVIGGSVARASLSKDPGWVAGQSAQFWREMRPLAIWATFGAVVHWSFSQSYSYVLASRANMTAVADVNAARLILMPTFVLAIGVKGLLAPLAATWLAESSLGGMLRRLLGFIAAIAALDLIYFALAWIFRDWLTRDLLHKVIGERDWLLALWAIVSLLSLIRDLLQRALFALHRFKALAWLAAFSAVISLGLMWFGIGWWGPAGVLFGQIAGELVNLVGIVALVVVAFRHPDLRNGSADGSKTPPPIAGPRDSGA